MDGAGNAAPAFVRTVVTFGGMPLNASATLAFGVAMLGRGTAICAIAASEVAVTAPAIQLACQIFNVVSRAAAKCTAVAKSICFKPD